MHDSRKMAAGWSLWHSRKTVRLKGYNICLPVSEPQNAWKKRNETCLRWSERSLPLQSSYWVPEVQCRPCMAVSEINSNLDYIWVTFTPPPRLCGSRHC